MKLFSLEEANALLPELRRCFSALKAAQLRMQRLAPEARRASEQGESGGGIASGPGYAAAIFNFMEALQTITTLGVEVKDPERGLCDFPHLREGRVVYLCWLLGEDRVSWWHDVEAGFAGRQRL